MTLRKKQTLFTQCIAKLILWAKDKGWEFTPGAGGVFQYCNSGHMTNSLHYIGLAADLNLFINGIYKSSHCPEWDEIGKFWLSLDPQCRWGGHFASKDYNHFSIAHEGRA